MLKFYISFNNNINNNNDIKYAYVQFKKKRKKYTNK